MRRGFDNRAGVALQAVTDRDERRMRVEEIVKELPKLSVDEMKLLARALQEAIEDAEDSLDVLAVLNDPGKPVSMDEMRRKCGL
jgi:hypothetical protein